jgi:hypothetical protein
VISSVAPSLPQLGYSVRSRQRNSSLSTTLWLQQQLSARVSMVYHGGVAFSRTDFESEISFPPLIFGAPIRLLPPPTRNETVVYGVRPVVGVESRIAMGQHAHLVPGVRLQAGEGRWLIRPAVGIGWMF